MLKKKKLEIGEIYMGFLGGLLIGLFVGVIIGVFTISLCVVSKESDG